MENRGTETKTKEVTDLYGAQSDVIGLRDAPNEVADLYGRKRGRPKSTDRRTHYVKVMLSPAELLEIEKLAEQTGKSKSDLLREGLLLRKNLYERYGKQAE